jgi:hypothetical protein
MGLQTFCSCRATSASLQRILFLFFSQQKFCYTNSSSKSLFKIQASNFCQSFCIFIFFDKFQFF